MIWSFNLIDFLQSFISYYLKNFLSSNLSSSLGIKHLDQVLISFQSTLINLFCSRVWNYRNKTLKDYQISIGLSKKSLKKKFCDKDKSVFLLINYNSSNLNINNFYFIKVNELVSDFVCFESHMCDIF